MKQRNLAVDFLPETRNINRHCHGHVFCCPFVNKNKISNEFCEETLTTLKFCGFWNESLPNLKKVGQIFQASLFYHSRLDDKILPQCTNKVRLKEMAALL